MRRFWAKKCRRDHLRSLWRSVVLVTVRRWQRSAATEGRWGSMTKCGVMKACDGLSCLWRSLLQVRHEVQWSYPSSHIPRVEVFWNEDPRWTVVPMTVRHTCRRGWLREQQKKLYKYGTTESMKVRRDHDCPSRGTSMQPHFGRFPAIRIFV